MGRDSRRFHDSQWEDSFTYGDGAATCGTAFHRNSTTGATTVDEEETYVEGYGAPLPPTFGQVRAQFNLTQSRSLHSTPSRTETTPDSSPILSEGSRTRCFRFSRALGWSFCKGIPSLRSHSRSQSFKITVGQLSSKMEVKIENSRFLLICPCSKMQNLDPCFDMIFEGQKQ
jgi:hypothetical protein